MSKNIVREFQDDGWVFIYDEDTRFIGAHHKEGGKQSVCEIRHPYQGHDFGRALAYLLNTFSPPNTPCSRPETEPAAD